MDLIRRLCFHRLQDSELIDPLRFEEIKELAEGYSPQSQISATTFKIVWKHVVNG